MRTGSLQLRTLEVDPMPPCYGSLTIKHFPSPFWLSILDVGVAGEGKLLAMSRRASAAITAERRRLRNAAAKMRGSLKDGKPPLLMNSAQLPSHSASAITAVAATKQRRYDGPLLSLRSVRLIFN